MLDKNKRGGRGAAKKLSQEDDVKYWLGGHLYCGLCGETMQGVSGTSKSGNLYYYYSCKGHRKHKCSLKNQKKDLIEDLVLYLLNSLISDAEKRLYISYLCYAYYLTNKTDSGAFLESLQNNLKDIEKQLKNFTDAIAMGIFNESTAAAMKELEEKKHLVKEQIKSEELKKQCEIRFEDIVKYFDSFVGNLEDEDTRKRVLDILVEKIYVYPDKLVLSLYFTEDKRELPFEETKNIIDNQKYIMNYMDSFDVSKDSEMSESMRSILRDDDMDF